MSFLGKEERQKCWTTRDAYWQCLDNNQDAEVCNQLRKIYEEACPSQWVRHFDRKRSYLQFKERIEKQGYDPDSTLKS